jgi:hypothetical protein
MEPSPPSRNPVATFDSTEKANLQKIRDSLRALEDQKRIVRDADMDHQEKIELLSKIEVERMHFQDFLDRGDAPTNNNNNNNNNNVPDIPTRYMMRQQLLLHPRVSKKAFRKLFRAALVSEAHEKEFERRVEQITRVEKGMDGEEYLLLKDEFKFDRETTLSSPVPVTQTERSRIREVKIGGDKKFEGLVAKVDSGAGLRGAVIVIDDSLRVELHRLPRPGAFNIYDAPLRESSSPRDIFATALRWHNTRQAELEYLVGATKLLVNIIVF